MISLKVLKKLSILVGLPGCCLLKGCLIPYWPLPLHHRAAPFRRHAKLLQQRLLLAALVKGYKGTQPLTALALTTCVSRALGHAVEVPGPLRWNVVRRTCDSHAREHATTCAKPLYLTAFHLEIGFPGSFGPTVALGRRVPPTQRTQETPRRVEVTIVSRMLALLDAGRQRP